MRGSLALIAIAMVGLAGTASAHESYTVGGGKFVITLGEQNEPVYTYDWTNLDFFVREDATNGTGGWVQGVEETVEAVLIAPGSEDLSRPIEPQFRTVGRYAFDNDYQLTQAGQYSVRLTGTVNGTDISGTYLLPGPREDMREFTFPDEDVPDLLELQAENEALRQDIADLRARLAALESDTGNEDGGTENEARSPGFGGVSVALALALALSLVYMRRRRLP